MQWVEDNHDQTGRNYDGTVGLMVHDRGGMMQLTEHSMALVPHGEQTLHMVRGGG